MSLNRKQADDEFILDHLYKMKLHEVYYPVGINKEVTKVHGGWIYSDIGDKGHTVSSTFVPDNRNKL